MSNFYQNHQNTAVGKLYEVGQAIEQLFTGSASNISNYLSIYAEIENLLIQLAAKDIAIENSTGSTTQLEAERAALIIQLTEKSDDLAAVNAQMNSNWNTEITTILNLNASVPTTAIYETNAQTINTIFLNTVVKGIASFSVSELLDLYAIAYQCIYEGGPAVVRAQALLALVGEFGPYYDCTPETVFGDDEKRQTQVLPNSVKGTFEMFQVQPNPAKDYVTITYQLEEVKEVQLGLFDLTGKQLQQIDLNEPNGQLDLSLTNLPEGIYFIRMESGGHHLYQEKIIKIR